MTSTHDASAVRYAVMRFDDRNRYGRSGVPATLLFAGGQRVVVWMKDATIEKAGKRNRFAKIVLDSTQAEAELLELLGEVGEYPAELEAYQLHFGIKPCRYPNPAAWGLVPLTEPIERGRLNCTALHVFSVDNPGTRDIDDALSLTPASAAPAELIDALGGAGALAPGSLILGIHVSDVASRLPPASPLFAWAAARCASCYHSGIGDADAQRGGSVPMLPPALAHDELSLNQGTARNAVSLFLVIDAKGQGTICARTHARTRLVNGHATNYAAFAANAARVAAGQGEAPGGDDDAEAAGLRACEAAAARLLTTLSGVSEPEELVAWTMIEYNSYFGNLLAQISLGRDAPGGLLRAQPEAGVAAAYAFPPANGSGVAHASLSLVNYAHCSSPIRRYADLHNQHVLFGTLASPALPPGTLPPAGVAAVTDAASLDALNARAAVIAQYHARVDAMELAHRCKEAPTVFRGKVEADDDGSCLFVYTEKRRVRVPLSDTYFAEPLRDLFEALAPSHAGQGVGGGGAQQRPLRGTEISVELCGVLKAGRTQLRLRVPDVSAAAVAPGAGLKAAGVPPARGGMPPGLGGMQAGRPPPTAVPTASGANEGGVSGGGEAEFWGMLASVGVPDGVVSALRQLGVTRSQLAAMGSPADLIGLTGCAPDEASTVLTIAASASEDTPPPPPPPPPAAALAALPSAPAVDAADASVPDASPDADAAKATVAAAESGEASGEPDELDAEMAELDAEMVGLLSRLDLKHSTFHQLASFGFGLGAMRLLAPADLVEMTGCSEAEASIIAAAVATADATAAAAARSTRVDSGAAAGDDQADDTPLSEEEVSAVLGYPIDDFQRRTLRVIVQPQVDLLAMAPTGSGKTAVALQAILQAFRRGHKAVYTSPIKALSNQKYGPSRVRACGRACVRACGRAGATTLRKAPRPFSPAPLRARRLGMPSSRRGSRRAT